MTVQPSRSPHQPAALFTDTADGIANEARQMRQQVQRVQDEIVRSVTRETANFQNVLLPFVQDENARRLRTDILSFYSRVSPSADLRTASQEAITVLEDTAIDALAHRDFFMLVEAVYDLNEELDEESQYLLERLRLEYIWSGAKLSKASQARFYEIQKQISRQTVAFFRNQREADDCIWFTPEDLAGLSPDFVEKLERGTGDNSGKVRVTSALPHLIPISQYAVNSETRRRQYMAYHTRCPENVPIFKEVVVLRDESARLLGYENYAALQLEKNMAGSTAAVNVLLESLRSRLVPMGQREVDELKDFKRKWLEEKNERFGGRVYGWDKAFYSRLLLSRQYTVDQDEVAEYFPLQHTIGALLGMFRELFGLVFDEITPGSKDGLGVSADDSGMTWAADVQVFSVWDTEDEGGNFRGYLYLDLLPRENKDDGISSSCIQPGFLRQDGSRHLPSAAVVCSFDPPTAEKPSLLKHFQLVSLFHELGHAMHDLVAETRYARFHGTAGPVDFGEGPSQMLENWCWTASTLKLMGRHYSYLSDRYYRTWEGSAGGRRQPAEQLPDATIDSLIRSKGVNDVSVALSMLLYAVFDMVIHQPSCTQAAREMNISRAYNNLRRELLLLDGPEEAGFDEDWSHSESNNSTAMTRDYAAGGYAYLYSQVFASDIFRSFFKNDPMNVDEARRYRHGVLKKGGSQDALKTVTDYLGRDIKPDAFYEGLGVPV